MGVVEEKWITWFIGKGKKMSLRVYLISHKRVDFKGLLVEGRVGCPWIHALNIKEARCYLLWREENETGEVVEGKIWIRWFIGEGGK